jgi:hypothetical protein
VIYCIFDFFHLFVKSTMKKINTWGGRRISNTFANICMKHFFTYGQLIIIGMESSINLGFTGTVLSSQSHTTKPTWGDVSLSCLFVTRSYTLNTRYDSISINNPSSKWQMHPHISWLHPCNNEITLLICGVQRHCWLILIFCILAWNPESPADQPFPCSLYGCLRNK